jgi:RimJ/RimL family protein N-acetyltransferase
MKKDEPFNPSSKSSKIPFGLTFRLALRTDCAAITDLMVERNPSIDISKLLSNTNQEIDRLESDINYKLYVAELDDEVVGFCRFFHSSGMPPHKKIFPSPEGWYGMGILVNSKFRRQNIARYISLSRIEILKNMEVKELYSIVDSNNLSSMKMHREFGYKEISRADGFLHLKFIEGAGVLFKINI